MGKLTGRARRRAGRRRRRCRTWCAGGGRCTRAPPRRSPSSATAPPAPARRERGRLRSGGRRACVHDSAVFAWERGAGAAETNASRRDRLAGWLVEGELLVLRPPPAWIDCPFRIFFSPSREFIIRPCLLPKFFTKLLQYLFRLFVTNIVQL